MIKTEWGHTVINGTGAVVLTDLIMIVSSIYKTMRKSGIDEEKAKELVLDSVNDAFNSYNESAAEVKEKAEGSLVDTLKEILEIIEEKEKKDE